VYGLLVQATVIAAAAGASNECGALSGGRKAPSLRGSHHCGLRAVAHMWRGATSDEEEPVTKSIVCVFERRVRKMSEDAGSMEWE
jgi:hypothetical protein